MRWWLIGGPTAHFSVRWCGGSNQLGDAYRSSIEARRGIQQKKYDKLNSRFGFSCACVRAHRNTCRWMQNKDNGRWTVQVYTNDVAHDIARTISGTQQMDKNSVLSFLPKLMRWHESSASAAAAAATNNGQADTNHLPVLATPFLCPSFAGKRDPGEWWILLFAACNIACPPRRTHKFLHLIVSCTCPDVASHQPRFPNFAFFAFERRVQNTRIYVNFLQCKHRVCTRVVVGKFIR